MSLSEYKKKRDFKKTKEPSGAVAKSKKFRFVIQRHEASRLHYDFRLELDGVLKSWAVPKGPSMNPLQKRLAVMVEDHPVEYISFSGDIPEGNYGAGHVDIWDKGTFQPVTPDHKPMDEKAALAALKKGDFKFALKGKKVKGEFVLVKLKNGEKNWLLIKHKDAHALNKVDNAEDNNSRNTNAPEAMAPKSPARKLKAFISPMLATLTKTPFNDPEWIYEIKWDGYRAIAETGKSGNKFYSRNGLDFSGKFPTLFQSLQKIKEEAVLDGEIVLLNNKSLPDFQKLQDYENNLNQPLIYYVFDILSLKGKNLEHLPLIERKAILKKLLGSKNAVIKYCDHIKKDGIAFLEKAKEQGLEGIIAKRADSTYASGRRSKDWLKLKNVQSTEVAIVGFTEPKGDRSHFGSLLLANKKGKSWEYRGHVGTGFTEELLASLYKKMIALKSEASPFKTKVPVNGKVTWIKPKLVADIAYTEITRDKIFRHPVFLRLRDEKSVSKINEEVVGEMADVSTNAEIKIGKAVIKITNQHKVFWPEEGYTKRNVVDYYDKMADIILPHLKDRPLSLKRNPNGIRDEGFFHKDAGENAPEYVKVFKVKNSGNGKIVDYVVCNNKATLFYLVNLGCIEINPWNSTIKKPDNPTWMVIDIDPSAKNTFADVVDVALATRKVLDGAGIKSYCKTSGSSGLHVFVPLKNKYSYDIVRDFAKIVATLINEELPKTTSLERSLKKRGDKIYIDYLQNRPGQTLASVYSLRPVAGASASAPLDWKEVNHKLSPKYFTIDNLFDRVSKRGDLFLDVIQTGNDLKKAMKLLTQES